MGSRASGAQRQSGSSPRGEGEARAEPTQNVPNSSYEEKKKTEKSLKQESPVSARQASVPALLAVLSLSRASARSL